MPSTPHTVPPVSTADARHDPGPLFMALFLASLGMGLGALLVFYIIMGVRAPQWPPAGTPKPPLGLWISTLLIVSASVTMHIAVHLARRHHRNGLIASLVLTLLLAVGFLVSQLFNWIMLKPGMAAGSSMFATCFYLLTGAHGVHIVGGLVPLIVVLVRTLLGYYEPTPLPAAQLPPEQPVLAKTHRRRARRGKVSGIAYCAAYWHFVDVVWLIFFAALMIVW